MRSLLRACLVLSLVLSAPYIQAAEAPLKFGLFPYVGPAKLVEHHGAFIRYLESQLHRRIQINSAPDFRVFLQRTEAKDFDIILTAPHFGRLAELKDGYQRIAMTEHHVQGVYLVRPDSPIRNIADLKGKTITIAAPSSIVYRLAERQMRDEYGLVDDKNIKIITTRTHNNSMYSAIKGESDAAVTGVKLYLGLIKRKGPVLRKIGETPKVPGFMLMARPGLSKALVRKLNLAAKSFSTTEAGRKYIFKGYQDIDDKTMQELDAYITKLP